MSSAIPDLWPEYVTVTNVLAPVTILKYQAGQLREKTKNLLEAEVKSDQATNGLWNHHFEIIAPVLDRYRCRLFSVRHEDEQLYPVSVSIAAGEGWESANTQEEFTALIRKNLNSPHTKSIIQSLLARSNELRATSGSPSPEEP